MKAIRQVTIWPEGRNWRSLRRIFHPSAGDVHDHWHSLAPKIAERCILAVPTTQLYRLSGGDQPAGGKATGIIPNLSIHRDVMKQRGQRPVGSDLLRCARIHGNQPPHRARQHALQHHMALQRTIRQISSDHQNIPIAILVGSTARPRPVQNSCHQRIAQPLLEPGDHDFRHESLIHSTANASTPMGSKPGGIHLNEAPRATRPTLDDLRFAGQSAFLPGQAPPLRCTFAIQSRASRMSRPPFPGVRS